MKSSKSENTFPFIFYEDNHLIVLSKPSGLLSQGEHTGDINLVDLLKSYFGRNYVGLVHRLDRNTSGIMVVGKRSKSAQRLTDALQSGKIIRTYLACVSGKLNGPVEWTHQLIKDSARNLVKVVSKSHTSEPGKTATLKATPIIYGKWNLKPVTLVEYLLDTGRSHQIRVQSAFEGFPIIGDSKYGEAYFNFPRIALHSNKLEFPHPMSGEVLRFEDPLPEELKIFFKP